MNEILEWLKKQEDFKNIQINRETPIFTSAFEVREIIGPIVSIYAVYVPLDMLISVTAPHGGNGYNYLLRANRTVTFDRWGNSEYEELLPTADGVIMLLTENDIWL